MSLDLLNEWMVVHSVSFVTWNVSLQDVKVNFVVIRLRVFLMLLDLDAVSIVFFYSGGESWKRLIRNVGKFSYSPLWHWGPTWLTLAICNWQVGSWDLDPDLPESFSTAGRLVRRLNFDFVEQKFGGLNIYPVAKRDFVLSIFEEIKNVPGQCALNRGDSLHRMVTVFINNRSGLERDLWLRRGQEL